MSSRWTPAVVVSVLAAVALSVLGAVASWPWNLAPPIHVSAAPVSVRVGDDLQGLIDRHPAGTTYRIGAGVHRLQSVVPQDGDRFLGEEGAVLSGAALLDPADFDPRGGRHVIDQQTHELPPRRPVMLEGRSREARPEELFADGDRLRHVQRLADVDRPNTWWFDYDADEIWVFDDPSDFATLEVSIAPFAFGGDHVRDVLIRGLEVRNYASPAQGGAIEGRNSIDWTVDAVSAINNHATGIRLGPGMRVTRCLATGNGQLGVGGSGRTFVDPVVEGPFHVSSCRLVGNHVLGYDWTWEAGGAKFTLVRGGVFANNLVSGHDGPGVWFDIGSRDVVVCANRIIDNVMGVFIETSVGAFVYGNEIAENVRGSAGDANAAVYISESHDVWVTRNLAWGQTTGVRARQIDRPDSALRLRGLHVNDNDLGFSDWSGVHVLDGDARVFVPGVVQFDDNVYRTDAIAPLRWQQGFIDLSTWQGLGHDRRGAVLPGTSAPGPFPSGVDRYTPVDSGAGASLPEPAAARCATARPS